jgi:HEAT repeat protein
MALAGVFSSSTAHAQDADANRDLFSNFMHNAVIGKFERAEAFAKKLLDSNPDPVAVMRYADEHTNALPTLLLLVKNAGIGESAKAILGLIADGERSVGQDPERIKRNIAQLGGDPLAEFNAIDRLRDSGEYAVTWLVAALQDSGQARLHNRIIRMLPKMGKDAVNPLSIALAMDDDETKNFIVRALGEIGYPQAAPFLIEVLQDQDASPELRMTVESALQAIGYYGAHDAGAAYLELARSYYENRGSLSADPRTATAQMWYWRDGRLQNTAVPATIFDEIMAMRCAERALAGQATNDEAVAVWLAANIRREAELGMDVESMDPDPAAANDATKVDGYPRSAYFARAAGSHYSQAVLDMALVNREPAVALGAIAALNLVAGESSMVGLEEFRQPLAAALNFPDMVVRIKAALALANALPQSHFAGAQNVVHILGEALLQVGGAHALVIDPDEQNLNRVMDAIRASGAKVIGETNVFAALDRARREMPSVNAIFVATDVTDPDLVTALSTIRSNNVYSMTPIVLLSREGVTPTIKQLSSQSGTTVVAADADEARLSAAWNSVLVEIGQTQLTGDDALQLAMQATAALRKIAINNSRVFDFRQAEAALIAALSSSSEALRKSAAHVLALIPSVAAQQAIAEAGLSDGHTTSMRIAALSALAESARINGNLLRDHHSADLVETAINESDLAIRTAAGVALGALDLPSNKAGQIITKYNRG